MSLLISIGYVLTAVLCWVVLAGLAMWLNGRGLLTPGSWPDRIAQALVRSIDWAYAALAIVLGIWLVAPGDKSGRKEPLKTQLRAHQKTRAAERKLETNMRRMLKETQAAATGRETRLLIRGDNAIEEIRAESAGATPDEAHAAWEKANGR